MQPPITKSPIHSGQQRRILKNRFLCGFLKSEMSHQDRKRILCVGMVCIDILNICNHYPEEDTDECCLEVIWNRGGNATNNCTVLHQFGVECETLASLAGDHCLKFIEKDLQDCGINYENCVYYKEASTPVAMVIINQKTGSRTIVYSMRNLPPIGVDDFKKLDLKKYKWIHFEAREMFEVDKMVAVIDEYNSTCPSSDKILISSEVEEIGIKSDLFLSCGDVIFVSKELAKHHGFHDMHTAVEGLVKLTRPGAIIICPWGKKGACARSSDGTIFYSPAFPPKKVLDTLGAGDAFDAAVIYALSNGQSLQDAITLGCKVAGKKCGIIGLKNILPF